jgi:hypothetical protein
MRLCYGRVYMCLPPVNKKPLLSGACVVTGEKWVETSFLYIDQHKLHKTCTDLHFVRFGCVLFLGPCSLRFESVVSPLDSLD